MGYQTWHELTAQRDGKPVSAEEWKAIMAEEVPSEEMPLDCYVGESQDWHSWLDDEEDMAVISARHPGITFKLTYQGDDNERGGFEFCDGRKIADWHARVVWERIPVPE